MNNNLLLVAWPYQGSIKFSTRVAVNYTPPTVISGPTVTAISSSVTATHWKWTFRCQDCTSWIAQGILGAIVQDSISVFGWAYSNVDVYTPSQANSGFAMHTDFRLWWHNIANAHSTAYPYDTITPVVLIP